MVTVLCDPVRYLPFKFFYHVISWWKWKFIGWNICCYKYSM